MKWLNYAGVVIAFITLTSVVIIAQQANPFIAQKKKVTVSRAKLREQGAQKLGDVLHALPSVIRTIANVQQIAMEKVCQYVEGEKKCFWQCASRHELDSCVSKIDSFQKQLNSIHRALHEFQLHLDSLEVVSGPPASSAAA